MNLCQIRAKPDKSYNLGIESPVTMTIAEIHGKISHKGSNIYDRLEDLLTSDVFTAFKYTKPETLLIPFISCARNINGSLMSLPQDEIKTVTYKFWPRLDYSEPDVLIEIVYKNSGKYLVMIEAKYLSGKSGIFSEEEEMETATTHPDQLNREYNDLLGYNIKTNYVARVLVYLTAHYVMPLSDLKESLAIIKKTVNADNIDDTILWISWREIKPVIEQQHGVKSIERDIISDLQKLLERKGLTHFDGFPLLNKVFQVNDYYSGCFKKTYYSNMRLSFVTKMKEYYKKNK